MFKKKRWKKTSPFRSFRRTGPSTKTLQRTKAAKRYNWVPLLDSTCSVAFLPPRACETEAETQTTGPFDIDCENGQPLGVTPALPVKVELIPPSTLVDGADLYGSDDVTVVRMVGAVTLQPYWIMRAAALNIFNQAPDNTKEFLLTSFRKDRNLFLRAGLKKEEWFWDEIQKVWGVHPRDPFHTEEWSETKWQRRWTFERFPGSQGGHQANIATAGEPVGICSDVHTAGILDNSFTEGTGTINIETDCTQVESVAPHATAGVWTIPDRPLRLSLSSRKRMRFRESEGLCIWMNYSSVDYERTQADAACNAWFNDLAVGFAVRSHVKALIET